MGIGCLVDHRDFFRRHAWVVVDVTGKAVEETANEVLVKLRLK